MISNYYFVQNAAQTVVFILFVAFGTHTHTHTHMQTHELGSSLGREISVLKTLMWNTLIKTYIYVFCRLKNIYIYQTLSKQVYSTSKTHGEFGSSAPFQLGFDHSTGVRSHGSAPDFFLDQRSRPLKDTDLGPNVMEHVFFMVFLLLSDCDINIFPCGIMARTPLRLMGR